MEHLTYTTDKELDACMGARGLHFYREYFRWGKTPAYCNDAKTLFRFVDRGDILTPTEMHTRLLDDWRPASRNDADYAAYGMRRDLQALAHLSMPHHEG